jgi:hypothetical protein
MNKAINVIKDLLIIILIVAFISLGFYAFQKVDSIKDSVSGLFTLPETKVNAFTGASINYNGGLTKTQIKEQKANDSCPTHSDVNDTIFIQDYGGIVCFYKEVKDDSNKTFYPNILFIKTDKGLKFDGALNMHGESYAGWFGMGYSYKVNQLFYNKPSYDKHSIMIFDNPYENYVSLTGFSGFITEIVKTLTLRQERIEQTQQYIIKNIYPYFLRYYDNNIEIMQDKETSNGDFNFFYDYLYRSAKDFDYGSDNNGSKITSGSCSVDISKLTVYPLPNELKGKYIIPNTNPTEYFAIYKCKVNLTCNYSLQDIQKDYSGNKDIMDGVKDDPIEIVDIPICPLCNTIVNLNPKGSYLNSTIKDIVSSSPITIEFYKDNDLYNKINFDRSSFVDSKGTITTGFLRGKYTYSITSNELLFDSFSGSIEIFNSSSIDFEYSYENGKVLCSFSVSPISSDVDYSNVDLSTYPVRIILNSSDKSRTYQFVFDNQTTLLNPIKSLILVGNYSYIILSEKLIFGSTSGSISISPQNRNFNYSFGIVYNRSDLKFSVNVSMSTNSLNGLINLSGSQDSVKLLGSKLNLQNYFVNIVIFDSQGKIVENFNHSHNGDGNCSDSFTATNLINGVNYTSQMTYANGNDISKSGYIEYQSSTFSFDYFDKTSYVFTYTCSQV